MTTWTVKVVNFADPSESGSYEFTTSFLHAALFARRKYVDVVKHLGPARSVVAPFVTIHSDTSPVFTILNATLIANQDRYQYRIDFDLCCNRELTTRLVCATPMLGQTAGIYGDTVSVEHKAFTALRRQLVKQYHPDLGAPYGRSIDLEVSRPKLEDLIMMVLHRFTFEGSVLHLEHASPNTAIRNLIDTIKGDVKSDLSLFNGPVKAILENPRVLTTLISDERRNTFESTPEVFKWIEDNEIEWRFADGKCEFVRDEDYTLYKVMFQ